MTPLIEIVTAFKTIAVCSVLIAVGSLVSAATGLVMLRRVKLGQRRLDRWRKASSDDH